MYSAEIVVLIVKIGLACPFAYATVGFTFCHLCLAFSSHIYRLRIPRRSDLLYFPAVPSSRFMRLMAVEALLSSRFAREIAAPSRLLSVLGEVRRL